MAASVVARDVSKSFHLKHGFTIRQAMQNRRQRRDPKTIVQALDNVTFRTEQGSGVALMGRNGSGKSTLLRLVSGVMRPDSGTIHVRGSVAGLTDLGAGMHPELTCRENIYLNASVLGMSPRQIESRFDAIVDFAEISRFLDTQVRFLSSGMFSRLGFAIAVHTEPDVFLVDEVLAVGDSPFKQKCRKTLLERRTAEGLTLIIVAHENALLRQLCTEAIVLDRGKLIYGGALAGAESLMAIDDGQADYSTVMFSDDDLEFG